MYSVSAAFLAAVRQSHRIANRLDVCSYDGTVAATISPSGGEVTVDSTRAVYRDCTFTVPDITGALVPALAGDLLSPLSGYELRPYRGVTYDDGTTELVPLGVFPIRSAPASTDSDGVAIVTVGGQDRSSTVRRNRWTVPYSIAGGTALEAALTALLADRAPLYPSNLVTTGVTVPATTFGLDTENDPWADAQSLAKAAGYDLIYDVTGTAVLQQPTDPTTASPVITYANDTSAVTVSSAKEWDAEKAYNGCIAIGESSTSTPVRAEVWDDDPSSPTYRLGAYGQYPEFYVSPFMTTADQCTAAATAQLARRRGVAQNVSWSQLVNPAHDANDAIAFTQTDLRISTALTVVVDTLRIPWGADGVMSATTRSRQVSV